MKQINLIAAFVAFSTAAWASGQKPAICKMTNRRLKATPFGCCRHRRHLRLHHSQGQRAGGAAISQPFHVLALGLAKREDAFKTAQWQVAQLGQGKPLNTEAALARAKADKLPPALIQKFQLQGSRGPVVNQRIPLKVAGELQITVRQ